MLLEKAPCANDVAEKTRSAKKVAMLFMAELEQYYHKLRASAIEKIRFALTILFNNNTMDYALSTIDTFIQP